MGKTNPGKYSQPNTPIHGGGSWHLKSNNAIRVEGVEDLVKNLKAHLTGFTEKEIRKALKPAAEIIVNDAKMRAPISKQKHSFRLASGERITVMPGMLQKSIMLLPRWRQDPLGLWVGPKVKRRNVKSGSVNAYYAHFAEYGTAAHNLGYSGKYVSVKGSDHPGSRPRPYMRPAYDTKANEAINKMYQCIEKMLFERYV